MVKGGDIMDNEKYYTLSKSKTKKWYEDCKKSVKDDKRFYSVESEWVMKIQWEDRYDQCGTNLPIFLACEHGEEWDIIVDDAFFKYSSQ
jgi:hypothetical protein